MYLKLFQEYKPPCAAGLHQVPSVRHPPEHPGHALRQTFLLLIWPLVCPVVRLAHKHHSVLEGTYLE